MRSWTDDDLRHAVATSSSLTDVIRALGLWPAGGNHRSVRAHIGRLGLATSHFTHDRRTRGIRVWRDTTRHSPESAFRAGAGVDAAVVGRLARKHLAPYVCGECRNLGVHNGKPLTLHLDHINGVHDDNRLENLRWLCPNCHRLSQPDPDLLRSEQPPASEPRLGAAAPLAGRETRLDDRYPNHPVLGALPRRG
jgi:5-methylcytosine-specific restriction endonuclease McrA